MPGVRTGVRACVRASLSARMKCIQACHSSGHTRRRAHRHTRGTHEYSDHPIQQPQHTSWAPLEQRPCAASRLHKRAGQAGPPTERCHDTTGIRQPAVPRSERSPRKVNTPNSERCAGDIPVDRVRPHRLLQPLRGFNAERDVLLAQVTREHFDGRVRRVPAQMWAALSSRPCSGQAAIAGPQLHVACAGKLSETDVVRARRRGAHQTFPVHDGERNEQRDGKHTGRTNRVGRTI